MITPALQANLAQKWSNLKKNYAFTLAEVLITLGIIGVVAALTIPILMANINNTDLKVKWKQTYSQFAQATAMIMQENGGTMQNLCAGTDPHNCFLNFYESKLKLIKRCASASGCGSSNLYFSDNSSAAVWNINYTPAAVLPNGSVFHLYSYGANAAIYAQNCSYGGMFAKTACAYVQVDVNGSKGPDKIGTDVFAFAIFSDGISPWGVNDYFSCPGGTGCSTGFNASADLLMQ